MVLGQVDAEGGGRDVGRHFVAADEGRDKAAAFGHRLCDRALPFGEELGEDRADAFVEERGHAVGHGEQQGWPV